MAQAGMNVSRRRLLETLALTPVAAASAGEAMSSTQVASQVKPRHVLCFLGRQGQLAHLSDAVLGAVNDFATDFTVDSAYSQDAGPSAGEHGAQILLSNPSGSWRGLGLLCDACR